MKQTLTAIILFALLTACLCGCQSDSAEIATMTPTESEVTPALPVHSTDKHYRVSTVDEFLAALNSNTVIEMAEGDYRLDQAADYGMDSDNPAYYWEKTQDGYELVLNHLHDLTIRGQGKESTSLLTAPRYANLLYLEGCKRIQLEDLTAGHTDGSELCSSGVIYVARAEDIRLENLGLFGCGIIGIGSDSTENLTVTNTDIYDCSLYAVSAFDVNNLNVQNCRIYRLGTKEMPASAVFSLGSCQNAAIQNCSITENQVDMLMELIYCQDLTLRNTEFHSNRIAAYAFSFEDCQPVFDHCDFEDNDVMRWYSFVSLLAADETGELIGTEQLPPENKLDPENLPIQVQVHVSNTDEFLEAIGPDREIIIDADLLDLSAASDYGAGISEYYRWEQDVDGPQLVISDVQNMTIRAEGQDLAAHTICSVPRYANVLSFRRCHYLTLQGFTAGHTVEPGFCTGGVLDFRECTNISVEKCGLYGCGVCGIQSNFTSGLNILDCDIYECSEGGMWLWNTEDILIQGNTFRDLGGPNVITENCQAIESDTPLDDYSMFAEG